MGLETNARPKGKERESTEKVIVPKQEHCKSAEKPSTHRVTHSPHVDRDQIMGYRPPMSKDRAARDCINSKRHRRS